MRTLGIFLLSFLALWLVVGVIGPLGLIVIAALSFAVLLNYCLKLDDRVEALERELHPERFPEPAPKAPTFGEQMEQNMHASDDEPD